MTDSTITIEVDGQKLQAQPGQMLIEVTDAAGISVPRFCYHDKLSVAANCRMCLVDVEKAPKPLPACATPCNDGMVVHTRSPRALAAQKGTMEFLLINHPLDCPICDQGGECELQDVAMGYGGDVSRFSEGKRVVQDPDLGSLVATDMTRCIHCTRCVRFGAEIAGIRELGATGRGEHMKIGTYIQHALDSELSGNIIDLCPVGALTSKPARFKARAWELVQHSAIAPHDSVGSNIFVHVRRNQVMRVVPRDNEAVNECWISDRDRFSYEGLYSDDRLLKPMARIDGKWKEVGWEEALDVAAKALSSAGDNLATLISPNATLEEMFLAQKLTRGLGSGHIDHRLLQTDFRNDNADPAQPWLGQSFADLESAGAVLLVGSNVRKEQPLIGHRIRKAALAGADIMALNTMAYDFNYALAAEDIINPAAMLNALAAVAKLAGCDEAGLKSLIDAAQTNDVHKQILESLVKAGKGIILLGNTAVAHPDFSLMRALAATIAAKLDVDYGVIPAFANSTGAWVAGAVPHRLAGGAKADKAGHNVEAMLNGQHSAYLTLGLEPDRDFSMPVHAMERLSKAKTVMLTTYCTDAMLEVADVLLPVAGYVESSGSLINAQGDLQSFTGVVQPAGEARPAWKVLRVLGNLTNLDGFDYQASIDVLDELKAVYNSSPDNTLGAPAEGDALLKPTALQRIFDLPVYSSDALVRRASSLQRTTDAWRDGVFLNATTAAGLSLSEQDRVTLTMDNENQLETTVRIDDRVCDGGICYPAGVPGSEKLNRLYGEVTLTKG